MKYIYYSSLVFALLLSSCSQQQRITKTSGSQPNTIAAQPAPDAVQEAVVPKRDYPDTFNVDPRDYYEDAYEHLQQMLEGGQPVNFKRAVFITENAWCQDHISYDAFNSYIKDLTIVCKAWEKTNPIINYHTYPWNTDTMEVALNGAIYHVMTDTIRDEKGNIISIPFQYDFHDCFTKDDWTSMFVTKLMTTHGGNCHSLPFLYKILSEELGTKAYLAMLPEHIYINQYSRKTSWYNTELTGRCFPVDAWLASSGYVSVASIRSRLYMDTLSLKESVALCVNDLAKGYERKFGDGDYKFVLKCCDLGLAYYPTYGELLLLKAETLKKLYQKEIDLYGLNAPDSKEHGEEIHSIYNRMEQTYNTLAKLDYREIPEALYSRWTDAMINGGKPESENIHDTVVTTNVVGPFGKKMDIIAVSDGKYVELFENDTLRRIGSVMFNNITHKVEYFILKDDEKYSTELERPKEPARFLSVDPMAKQFPELSPYQYASNTPIEAIDLDGLEKYILVSYNVSANGNTFPYIVDAEFVADQNRAVHDENSAIVVNKTYNQQTPSAPQQSFTNPQDGLPAPNDKAGIQEESDNHQVQPYNKPQITHKLTETNGVQRVYESGYEKINFTPDQGRTAAQVQSIVSAEPQLKKQIDHIVAILHADPNSRVNIIGSASQTATNIAGTQPNTTVQNNQNLAAQRASAGKAFIISYYQQTFGVALDPSRITTSSTVSGTQSTTFSTETPVINSGNSGH